MTEVENLESQKKDLKEIIDRSAAADRLSRNKDFRNLILEEFCVKEAARYVQLSADPARTQEERQDALNIAQASGHLKRYLSVIFRMGESAERAMEELENALEEARFEEAQEGDPE